MDFLRGARGEISFIAIDVDLGLDLPAVLVDQGKGSLLAIRHVTALGHRRIAFICGPLSIKEEYESIQSDGRPVNQRVEVPTNCAL